jgi:hypothetical protein
MFMRGSCRYGDARERQYKMHRVTPRLGLARGSTFSGDIGKVRAAFQGDFLPLD